MNAEDLEQLKSRAKAGDPEAQFELSTYYISQKDTVNAIYWLKAASEKQHVYAMTNLAIAYYYGDGVPQSYQMAWPLFLAASQRGDLSAKYYLGLSYIGGNGLVKNERKGFEILRECAIEGMPWAQLSLADCYKDGIGTNPDLFEAVSWYARAAVQGIEEAGQKFNAIYYSTHFTDSKGKQRLFWFEEEALKR